MVAPRGLALRISCAFAGAALAQWTENSFTLGKVLGFEFHCALARLYLRGYFDRDPLY